MNVVFDYQAFNHQVVGGVSRYFSELIAGLAARGDLRILLVLGLTINRHIAALRRRKALRVCGLPLPRAAREHRLLSALNRLIFSAVAARSCADLYHATYYTRLAPRLRARRVITVFDMIQEIFPDLVPPEDPTPRRKRMAIERADGIICISETTRGDLARLYPETASRARVIPLGVTLNAIPSPAAPYDEPYVLFVGRRGRHKNFGALLEAYASSPALRGGHLLVCFGGPSPSPAEVHALRAAAIEGRVVFAGGGDEALATHYRHAALLVCPSLYEGFGLPPLEAMRYGCPAAVANTPALRETLGDAGVFFDPRRPEQIADCMLELLASEQRRKALAEAGRNRLEQFTLERCVTETARFYREVAS